MAFNHEAAAENKRNKEHTRFHNDGHISVDANKATYKGIKVKDLNAHGRKKFENLIILTNMDKAKGFMPKVRYE